MSVFLTGLLAIFLGPYLSLVLPGIGENAGVPRSPLLCLSRAWNKGKKERGAATGRGSVHNPNGESTSLRSARSTLVALLVVDIGKSPCHGSGPPLLLYFGRGGVPPPLALWAGVFLTLGPHSISFARSLGIPLYNIGLGDV